MTDLPDPRTSIKDAIDHALMLGRDAKMVADSIAKQLPKYANDPETHGQLHRIFVVHLEFAVAVQNIKASMYERLLARLENCESVLAQLRRL